MKFIRATIKGWTTSFRYPTFISGKQPSMRVPPPSTILGLLSAMKGELLHYSDIGFAYSFTYQTSAFDLESIYTFSSLGDMGTNIAKREILFNFNLFLYVDEPSYIEYFLKPYYIPLLGRSQDLVSITDIKEIDVEEKSNTKIIGTAIPFPNPYVYGTIAAMSHDFSEEIPRKPILVKPCIIVEESINYPENLLYDKELNLGLWLHGRLSR